MLTNIATAAVPTPQIYKVVPSQDNSYRPWVTGLTPNGVEVEILMDGESQGMAKVVPDESGTASFGWAPQQDLPVGWHEFRVRGKYGANYSSPGAILGFNVEHPTPAPILEEPTQLADYILISGLVKNDLAVKIYIDDTQVADFSVPDHPSGTTNFWFKARGLLNGLHEVYVAAYDDTGKLSKFSNVQSFKTEQQKITKGEDEAVVADAEQPIEPEVSGTEVIDTKVEGAVGIVEPTQEESEVTVVAGEEGGAVTVAGEEDGKVTVATDENGEISSIAEVNDAALAAEQAGRSDKEQRNRVIGLVILGIMVIILLGWYWVEKKNAEKKSDEPEAVDKDDKSNRTDRTDKGDRSNKSNKTDEVDKIDDLGF